MQTTDTGTFVIVTEASSIAPEGTTVHPPINPEPFTTDFGTAYELFTAEVERQLSFGPEHNHPFDESDPEAFWESEDCPWCEDAMIWENWASAEGLIVQADYFDLDGSIAIGLTHVDVFLRRA